MNHNRFDEVVFFNGGKMLFEKIDLSAFSKLKQMPVYHTLRFSDFGRDDSSGQSEVLFDKDNRQIISDSKNCKECEVFHQHLVYCFYGRPVYKWEGAEPFPIFFVFSSESIEEPAAIYPFDSGAFFHGRYEDAYSSNNVTDYCLGDAKKGYKTEDVPRMISMIWETNLNYYEAEAPCEYGELFKELIWLTKFDKEYVKMVLEWKGKRKYYKNTDSRAMTIEYIYKNVLKLESLIAVYVPNGTGEQDIKDLQIVIGEDVNVECLPGFSGDVQEAFDQMVKHERQRLLKEGSYL